MNANRVPAASAAKSSVFPWLRLLRLPTLLTAFGDPAATFWIAGGTAFGALGGVVASVLFAYAGGMVMNDLADIRVDAAERPERPLPSGAVSVKGALRLLGVLLTLSLLSAAFVSAGTLLCVSLLWGVITAYNLFLKHHPLTSPLGMTLCRLTSLLCGVVAARGLTAEPLPPELIYPFVTYAVYIAGLSRMARDEMQMKAKVAGRFGILIGSAFPLAAFAAMTASPEYQGNLEALLMMGLGVVILMMGFRIFVMMSGSFRTPKMVQESVREVMAIIPLFQATWFLLSSGIGRLWIAAVLVGASILFIFLTRKIKAS